MSNESTIHIKNIKVLMTKIYKFLNDLSSSIMNDKGKKTITLKEIQGPQFPNRNVLLHMESILSLFGDLELSKIFLKTLKILIH